MGKCAKTSRKIYLMSADTDTLYRSEINSLKLINSGKVRDIYAVDDDHMLIVTSDRISAFDVVMPDPIRTEAPSSDGD